MSRYDPGMLLKDGRTSLLLAAEFQADQGHASAVAVLLSYGANTEAQRLIVRLLLLLF